MDLLIQALIDSAIKMGQYLATLPEQDREKVAAQWKAQAAATHADVTALSDELAALKAKLAAAQTPPQP